MNLKFEFTLEEANFITANLGKQPYEMVALLIDKMRMQAAPQINPPPKEEDGPA